jgi:hypothetical protein
MGVIRKKTISRGGEGGVKYVCDVCSSDITSTVGSLAMLPVAWLLFGAPKTRFGDIPVNLTRCHDGVANHVGVDVGPHSMCRYRLQ